MRHHRLPQLRAALALTFAALATPVALAQWQPTIRFLGMPTQDWAVVVDSVQRYQGARRDIDAFASSIGFARRHFYSTIDDPAQRPDAEKRFAELLQRKDYYYLRRDILRTSQDRAGRSSLGQGQRDIAVGKLLDLQIPPEIDGGIRDSARPAFEKWSRQVIADFGDFASADNARVVRALAANRGSYDAYVKLRDRAELERWQLAQASPHNQALRAKRELERSSNAQTAAAALGADGSPKLMNEQIEPFGPFHLRRVPPSEIHLLQAAQTVKASVLQCVYGPIASPNGGLVRRVVRLWKDAPPPEIGSLIALDAKERYLGESLLSRRAYARCPATERIARAGSG